MSGAPLRVVQLRDALVQTSHSGSVLPCAPPTETVLVDSAVGSDGASSQVDKMIQTVQEAQKKLTHMLSVPELSVSVCMHACVCVSMCVRVPQKRGQNITLCLSLPL